MSPRKLVVTGPTGWLGQVALHRAADWLGPEWPERVLAFGSSARTLTVAGRQIAVAPLRSAADFDLSDAVVLHLAYLTKDRLTGDDATYFAANHAIDGALEAALLRTPPAGLFVASSGAASQVERGINRNLYGMMKLLQEERFGALGRVVGCPVFLGRIFNLAGPHINKPDLYALASFITQALEEGRVTIQAVTPVYRAYLHVEDVLDVVFAHLSRGEAPTSPCDLAGAETLEMDDVARVVAAQVGLPPSAVHRGTLDLTRRSVYLGDPCAFRDLCLGLGRTPRSFDRQVADTIGYLRTIPARSG